jgi:hypothetical protein
MKNKMVKIKSVKYGKMWAAEFTIGVQTFTVAERHTKKEADWYCKMLSIAFKSLTQTPHELPSVEKQEELTRKQK